MMHDNFHLSTLKLHDNVRQLLLQASSEENLDHVNVPKIRPLAGPHGSSHRPACSQSIDNEIERGDMDL